MTYTKDFIKEKILEDDRWLRRGILAIYSRQTEAEQARKTTIEDNGIGFNGVDAPFLSSLARQLQVRDWLSEKQSAIARRKMTKYAGQLEKIAGGKL